MEVGAACPERVPTRGDGGEDCGLRRRTMEWGTSIRHCSWEFNTYFYAVQEIFLISTLTAFAVGVSQQCMVLICLAAID
ncbi:hypothetical protein D5086_003338 [Populus alba]|uniref:Uncharacterized protein n=1 Tax=Populus alba TaxID=43335 RepID=A0ACC4D5A2_POPAL